MKKPRVFVLGDVHGACKALRQVFRRSDFDFENDTLVSIGDLVDGWPEPAECVEELLRVKNLVAIRGNHDEWMREYLQTGEADSWWFGHFGGRQTIAAYKNSGKIDDPRHREFFLQTQRAYFVDEQKRLFVHAGYNFNEPIEKQRGEQLWMSRNYWNYLLRDKFPGETHSDVNGFSEVFIGHTQTVNYFSHDKPVHLLNCWNVDQGCKSLGRLTLMNVDTKEYVQSDPVFTLYPDTIS